MFMESLTVEEVLSLWCDCNNVIIFNMNTGYIMAKYDGRNSIDNWYNEDKVKQIKIDRKTNTLGLYV